MQTLYQIYSLASLHDSIKKRSLSVGFALGVRKVTLLEICTKYIILLNKPLIIESIKTVPRFRIIRSQNNLER